MVIKRSRGDIEVRASFAGQGVFALRRFQSGETIGRVPGKVFTDPEYGSEYCIDIGDSLSLEPAAPFRYLNHSCEPNAKLYVVTDKTVRRSGRRVELEALRFVEAGEEVTIDYAWSATAAIPCRCGSPKCRGWVVSEDELEELLEREGQTG